MKPVNKLLVTWTARLLRHSRLSIMVPILAAFLLAYSAVYDFTLVPLNGRLLSVFDDCVLTNGRQVSYRSPVLDFFKFNRNTYSITKATFAGTNVLKYDSLRETYEYTQSVSEASAILSPLSFLPSSVFAAPVTEDDKRKVEKCFLKLLNHDLPTRLVSLLFDDFGKQNHVINLAQRVSVLVLADKEIVMPVPEWNKSSLRLVSYDALSLSGINGDMFFHDTLLRDKNFTLDWLIRVLVGAQAGRILVHLFNVYLSICNNHKVRSNIGLVIGWVNGVLVSAFASLALFSTSSLFSNWPFLSGPAGLLTFGFHLLSILVLSSRTLFRTVNDLAGDSTFGGRESLHKRLIKFYLGFNSSVENSRGVFHLSLFIRRTLCLDAFRNTVPIPNTTIVLLINITGLSLTVWVTAMLFRLFLDTSAWHLFVHLTVSCFRLTITTLIIDHILQLTYLVAIIVIDLRRIELTDVLAKVTVDDDPDNLSLNEVNPISKRLLACKVDTRYLWNRKLGTYLLKVSPASPRCFWLKVVPPICFCFCGSIAGKVYLDGRSEYLFDSKLGLLGKNTMVSNGNNALYYFELAMVLTLIVAISELVFMFTYSQRQKDDLDSSKFADQTELCLSELSNIDDTGKFEAITLNDEGRHSEKLALFANSHAPFLVTTDLDHQVLLWSPLSRMIDNKASDISTFFETSNGLQAKHEFWPVNHVEISNDGGYILLINNRNCRIKCFNRSFQKYEWEISLTSELAQPKGKMKPVLCFFRKKTVAGFFARELLLRRNRLSGGSRRSSNSSLSTMHGNFPPPLMSQNWQETSKKNGLVREYEEKFNRDEFVMILETGEMITISCDSVKVKVYNFLCDVFPNEYSLMGLRILSLKFLTTSRVNDRVVCAISNGDIVIGSAINNIWRYLKLNINKNFTSTSLIAYAPPSMTRGTWVCPDRKVISSGQVKGTQAIRSVIKAQHYLALASTKFPPMNGSTLVTIDFVGMLVRVRDLQAELIDIQTGTVLRLFHIGSFKAGTFRVSHSEPTRCKFCGCVSFKTMSLIYEDLYEKTLIVHTFRLDNKKSRNNICLRVERDPLEVRCLGFDSVVESQYWFDNIELWVLTDMNVVVGIKKVAEPECSLDDKAPKNAVTGSDRYNDEIGLSSLRNRKQPLKRSKEDMGSSGDRWQGCVITMLDGKLLDYNIPMDKLLERNGYSVRPNLIIKFGFKAVAIAFGHVVKVIYLGNDKLIQNDLYCSGSASTINPLLRPGVEDATPLSKLFFINKRRNMSERNLARSNRYSPT